MLLAQAEMLPSEKKINFFYTVYHFRLFYITHFVSELIGIFIDTIRCVQQEKQKQNQNHKCTLEQLQWLNGGNGFGIK